MEILPGGTLRWINVDKEACAESVRTKTIASCIRVTEELEKHFGFSRVEVGSYKNVYIDGPSRVIVDPLAFTEARPLVVIETRATIIAEK